MGIPLKIANSRPFLSRAWVAGVGMAWQVNGKEVNSLVQRPNAGGKIECPPNANVLFSFSGMVIEQESPSV